MKRNKLKGKIIEKYGSSKSFAEKIGVTPQTVANVISGRTTPRGASMMCWTLMLDINDDEISVFFGKEA